MAYNRPNSLKAKSERTVEFTLRSGREFLWQGGFPLGDSATSTEDGQHYADF